jgi:glucose-6-phosphate isomerase
MIPQNQGHSQPVGLPLCVPNPATSKQLLLDLAEASDLKAKTQAMFSGEHINSTEDRAVLHVATRARRDQVGSARGILAARGAQHLRLPTHAHGAQRGRCVQPANRQAKAPFAVSNAHAC